MPLVKVQFFQNKCHILRELLTSEVSDGKVVVLLVSIGAIQIIRDIPGGGPGGRRNVT